MAEYIERANLISRIEYYVTHTPEGNGGHYAYSVVLNEVLNRPAADVAPVVHSYWESYDCNQYMGTDEYGEPKWRDGRFYVCHNYKCRRKTVIKSNFCPNCGAKMDGGAENG